MRRKGEKQAKGEDLNEVEREPNEPKRREEEKGNEGVTKRERVDV